MECVMDRKKGWGVPTAAHKAHYFGTGSRLSLCRNWLYTGSTVAEIDDAIKCRSCVRLKESRNDDSTR